MSTTVDAPPTTAGGPGRSALDVLASARGHRVAAQAHEAALLADVVEWVVEHPAELGTDEAAAWRYGRVGRDPLVQRLNGDGVPCVSSAAVAELGVALSMPPKSAQELVAEALELAFRLPRLWARVVAGEVPPWRARSVASATLTLPAAAAAAVDRQVAPVAHRRSFSGIARLVGEALLRHDPQTYWDKDAEARERRHVDVGVADTTLSGLTPVGALLDLSDALDLEAAVGHAAAQRRAWGSQESDAVSRARGLGDLAREHLAWFGQPLLSGPVLIDTDPAGAGGTAAPADGAAAGGEVTITSLRTGADAVPRPSVPADTAAGSGRRVPPPRQVMLYVHLSQPALDAPGSPGQAGAPALGRVENTGAAVTAETIRRWCGASGTQVIVRPVLDLGAVRAGAGYEIPERLREQTRLRDGTCVFPGCTVKGLSCQVDHIEPYDHEHPEEGGRTESGNLALLCSRHHHLKTFAPGWRYRRTPDGSYEWTTPAGMTVTRNAEGTRPPRWPGRPPHPGPSPPPPEP